MKVCSICKKENENVKGEYCIFCGGKLVNQKSIEKPEEQEKINIETNTNKNKQKSSLIFKIAIEILTLIICVLICVIVYLVQSNNTEKLEKNISSLENNISTLDSQKKTLKKEKEDLEEKIRKNNEKINFYDKNVVFVIDGYGRYYYTYDQMEQVTQGTSFEYWAYNKEQAIDLGYKKWK